MRVHPDSYLTYLSGFLTYDGETMPRSIEWGDARTPRCGSPVLFVWVHRAGYWQDGRGAVLGYLGVWNHGHN